MKLPGVLSTQCGSAKMKITRRVHREMGVMSKMRSLMVGVFSEMRSLGVLSTSNIGVLSRMRSLMVGLLSGSAVF